MKNKLTGISLFLFLFSLIIFASIITGVLQTIVTTGIAVVVVMIFAIFSPVIGLILSFIAPASSINNLSMILNLVATVCFVFVYLSTMLI